MNYRKIYADLIERALSETRVKTSDAYYERHHIVPTSLGGSNAKSNLVLLTAREHFIAHWLLWKMETGTAKVKMGHDFGGMRYHSTENRYYTARGFAIAKQAHALSASEFHRGKILTEEQRQYRVENNPNARTTSVGGITFPSRKHAAAHFNTSVGMIRRHMVGEITFEQMTGVEAIPRNKCTRPNPLRGTTRDPSIYIKATETRKRNGSNRHSEEARRKMSEAAKGRPGGRLGMTATVETRTRISNARKGMHVSKHNYVVTAPNDERHRVDKIGLKEWFRINFDCTCPTSFKLALRREDGLVLRGKWKGWKVEYDTKEN